MHHNKSMYITNVEKEGPFLKIWGQIDKKSSLEVEEALLRASERFDEGKYNLKQNSLEVGILCCAKYVDEKYYRARVASIALLTDGIVEVNFIDYGNKDVIPVDNLRSLECFNPSFISLPPLSTPFILAEVVCIGGEWNDRIVEQISKEIRYMEHNYVIIAQAIRYYFIKVFVHDIDLGLHLVRQNLMQSTSIQTQEAVLLAMIPRTPQPVPPANQSLLQYKSFTLEPNSQQEVYVSYITDGPCHFSVQLKKYESALAQLMREINSIPLKPLDELPIPGTVCLAKCVEDNHICRAVVTSEVDSQYKLFYVDFGNTELVPPENLYQMAFKFIIPKIMAIRLSLANIEKTSMTLEMQCAFKQFVDNRLLMMEVIPAVKKMALPKCRMWDPDTNTDIIEVLNRAAKCAYPDPIALHKGFTQVVKVSFVYSCNRFYVQLKSKEGELNKLMEDLQVYCNSNQTSYLDEAKEGQPCCALFSFDQKWYRSLITEVVSDNAKVRYIDFGNEEFVPVDSLKVVEGEYLTVLRPQAIECCLNGYQNMTEDQERDIKLEELILEQEFTMKVIDSIGSKTLVDLMDAANTTVTALLLESIIAQTKVQTTASVPETNRFDGGGKRQGAGEEWRGGDDRTSKPYFQHDDRRSPRGQTWKEKTDDNTSWRQNSRKRSDSNSNDSTESWRQDNRGFKNRKENDWNDRPSNDNNFKKDRGFRGRSDNAENERPSRNSNRYSEGKYWNNRRGFRDQNGEWGGAKEDGYNQSRPPRNQNENRGAAKEDTWNQYKSSRKGDGEWSDGNSKSDRPWKDNNQGFKKGDGEWSDSNSKGDRAWKENNQGFKKKYDRNNKEWGKNDSGDFRGRNKTENSDWNNKTERGDWNNKTEKGDWNNKTEKGDWNNKTEKGDWNNKTEKGDWNNKNSGGGGEWDEKKSYKNRNTNRDEWNANKGDSDRKFGDRNRENDRGDFKKKSFRREASEQSSSGSEKSFGKGLRTSSRNDNRPPRSDRNFGNKGSDNSWNVSAVPSVIDNAPNDAKFKSIDVSGRQEKVTISWFHNPCSFFCQLVESQEAFKKLMEDIQQAYKGRPAVSCVKGAPAIGLFPEDNVLYRARIIDVLGTQYKIHYVDFGNVSLVDKVWPIENKFMEMPMQAVPCGLSALEPVGDDWPNPDNFSEYFEREGLDCTFQSCDESGRYWVNLTMDNEDVTNQLVNNALAKYSESTAVNVEIAFLVGQQFRAMLQLVEGPSDLTMVLQSGITLTCTMHNLATATEINEDLLKQHVNQIVIVYVDDLVDDRLEVTLYDSTGTKLNVIEPDEGAFDTVDPLCPHLVFSSTLRGFVSHVKDDGVVIQPVECAQNVEYVLEQMYEYYENMPPPDAPLIPEEESVYAVKSDDGNWYRGRVTAFDDDKASVTYIDYGNSEEVGFSRLRDLTPEILMWDAMAVLVNVKVPTADFVEQDVTATIFCGETGWDGEIQIAEATEQNLPSQIQPVSEQAPELQHTSESEHALESSSVQFTETSTAEITQVTPETTLPQSGETTEISIVCEESASSGVENENVCPSGGTPVVLSHVDSPSDFYIQLVDSLTAIDDLQLRLQDMVGEMTQLESASVGGLCAAPYSVDQKWYRSQILDADDDITTVRFIDYGNTDVIDNNATQIKTLPVELLALEEYATRCRLKIKPSEEDWPKATIDRFERLTVVENLTVEFVDQDEKTNYVELYSDGENVKDVLIGENLALLDDVVLEGKLTGFVSHMNSPSEFWVQLESCCAELEWIAEQLSNAGSFQDLEDLTPGSLCAAMFPDDEMWYRARILSNTVAGLEVLFLDYGNSCVCSNLKQLPEHLVMAPPLAQKCSLQRPEGVSSWGPEATQRFSELSADGQTIFTVKKLTTGETSIVELSANGEDVSSKLLIDNGYVTDVDSAESSREEITESGGEEKLGDGVIPEIQVEVASEPLIENVKKETAEGIIVDNKITPPVAVEIVSELTEENNVKKTIEKEIKQNKEDEIIEELELKLGDNSVTIPPVDCKEEPLEKFKEASDKGKPHQDIEYLSDTTVRLYLDENTINNELKELLSPILKEKTSRPVSVIATIEIVPETTQKGNKELTENSVEFAPCESHNTSLESSCLESNMNKSTKLDSESQEVDSVKDTSPDNTIHIIESLLHNIVDVQSNTPLDLEKEGTSISEEDYANKDQFAKITTAVSEETEIVLPFVSFERIICEDKFSSVLGEESKYVPHDESPEESICEDVFVPCTTLSYEEVLSLESSDYAVCEDEIATFTTISNEEVSPAKFSQKSICDNAVTLLEKHVIAEHKQDTIVEDELDVAFRQAADFVMTEKEKCDNITQQEKNIKTETKAKNVTTQLEIVDETSEISNVTEKNEINTFDQVEVKIEYVEKVPENSDKISTDHRNALNITDFDMTKLRQGDYFEDIVDTETHDKNVSTQLKVDDATCEINDVTQINETNTFNLDEKNSENVEQVSKLIDMVSTELPAVLNTQTDITKLREGEYYENKDDTKVPNIIQTHESEFTKSCRKGGTIPDNLSPGDQTTGDLDPTNSQILIEDPKVKLTDSSSEVEERINISLGYQTNQEYVDIENYNTLDNLNFELKLTESGSVVDDIERLLKLCDMVSTDCGDVLNAPVIDTTERRKDEYFETEDNTVALNVMQTQEPGFTESCNKVQAIHDKLSLVDKTMEELETSQILNVNPELKLPKSGSVVEEIICSKQETTQISPRREGDPTEVVYEDDVDQSQQKTVENQSAQNEEHVNRVSLEVAREYLELHSIELKSATDKSDQIPLDLEPRDKISVSVSKEQETDRTDSNIVIENIGTCETPVCGSVNQESVANEKVCSDSESCDISQQNSVINLKLKEDKSCAKVEFRETILTSFSAPTVSESPEAATKLSPTKIVPKFRKDSIADLDENLCEKKENEWKTED